MISGGAAQTACLAQAADARRSEALDVFTRNAPKPRETTDNLQTSVEPQAKIRSSWARQ